jgi:two-component system, NarL family, response regulator DesR
MAQNNDPPIRLLIVENQTTLADALAAALVQRGNIHIVGVTPAGIEAVDLVKKLQPDMVLLDTYLKSGKMESIKALEAIKQYRPETRVLFLSEFAQPIVQNEVMAAGADGYITKDRGLDEIVMAIKMVFRGKKIVDFDSDAQVVLPGDQLSEREQQILAGICRGQSNREIGNRLQVSEATVRNTITVILAKLQCTNRLQAVARARMLGYLPPYEGCD